MGFEPMTSAILVQRSTNWANKPTAWIFFSGLISTTSSVVFMAARISYIRFFTAVHMYDFHISSIIISSLGWVIWIQHNDQLPVGSLAQLVGITVNSPTDQLADANSPTYKIE